MSFLSFDNSPPRRPAFFPGPPCLLTPDSLNFKLPSANTFGKNRLACINFNNKRIKLVATALVHLSMKPGGFTSLDLANQINDKLDARYSTRYASYDI